MIGCCLVAKPVALQASRPMGFPRQEYWCGLSFLSPRRLPEPETKPISPVLGCRPFNAEPPGKPKRRPSDWEKPK